MSTTPDKRPSRAGSLPLVGGVLALDFANTASGRDTADHREHLRTTADLLAWARHAAILDARIHARLVDLCDHDPGFSQRLLATAIGLRDAIYRLDAALARHDDAAEADIDAVAGLYAACLTVGRLGTQAGGFGWSWEVETAPAETVLGPISSSAMMLITTADRARLKQCGGHHCGWLFLDTTKSNNRRWCEMEVCGNRAKQKRRRGRLERDG